MLRSEILDVAADELAAAAASIERERPAQAVLFLAAYEKKLRQIERFPRSGSIVQDSPGGIEFRVVRIQKFNCSIVTTVVRKTVTVVAVMHRSREPGCELKASSTRSILRERTVPMRIRNRQALRLGVQPSQFDLWVSENGVPDTFEYRKGWCDYVEFIQRFAWMLETDIVRVVGHYFVDTPPPCERLPMPAVAIEAKGITFALRFD